MNHAPMPKPVQQPPQPALQPDWARYEQMKRDWIKKNPGASTDQYSAAIRQFSKECGV